jgi:bacteriocin-like protein
MKTLENAELAAINGGDSFWEDLGEFVGGAVGGAQSGFGNVPGMPHTILSGPLLAGLLAAVVN